MSPGEAYAQARAEARRVREQYGISGPCLRLQKMREIFKDQGIQIVYWKFRLKKLRGAYISDEDGTHVMIAMLPNDPKLFTLAHELKHHLLDSGICSTTDVSPNSTLREIAAEVFAAELLLPEDVFVQEMSQRGVELKGSYELKTVQQVIVAMKRETGTTLSYMGIAKRAGRLGYAKTGDLLLTKWKLLEEARYGVPFYRRIRTI